MKIKVFQALMGFLITAFLPTASFAGGDQSLAIQNVILEPGDVINLVGGKATYLEAGDSYGHTAMYLGRDPQSNEKIFLDFTTEKKGAREGSFEGKILNEQEFLSASMKEHKEFDIYRTQLPIDQTILVAKAKENAAKHFGLPRDCANAVSNALDAAITEKHSPIKAIRPDFYAESDKFTLVSPVRINIEAALNQLNRVPDNGVINGTWTGTASSSEGLSFNVTLNIQNVTSGTGRFDWDSGRCGGSLSGGYQEQERAYVYGLNITNGRRTSIDEEGCVDGTIKLILGSEGIAHYSWNGVDVDGKPMSSGGVLGKR